ncbi:hypothetical protein, partial [Pseudoalteromonas ruthenica]|uniref:hypothetical protein n=1 Tax=Pseudoalteromonas ruthenica TaxID=151081 RepID=UPI001BB253DA
MTSVKLKLKKSGLSRFFYRYRLFALFTLRGSHSDTQLLQSVGICHTRGIGHQTRGLRRFREGNANTNILCTSKYHSTGVKAE